jgi:hypothetical protein
MAKVTGGFGLGITGSLGDLSIYTMRGVEKPVVRQKGGPTKEKIKNDPKMERVRNSNAEFGGRATATKWIMKALIFQRPLADHNIAGPLNALLKSVQILDPEGELGERHVRLSAAPHLLKGFSLNHKNSFDSTVRFPLDYELSRETASAIVQVPELIPDISLFTPEIKYPWYSVRVTLGFVPDVCYVKAHKRYETLHPNYAELGSIYVDTAWYPVIKGSPALTVEIKSDKFPPDGHFTIVLAVGVRYGILEDADQIRQAPYAGCAKVLAVG